MQASDQLIVALDFSTAREAVRLVDTLGDLVTFYKVGMQLYFAEGNAMIAELQKRQKKVFLDLKINDIPETVALAVGSVARLGVQYLTLFTGEKQLKAARQCLDALNSPLKLLNVSVLTSEESDFVQVAQRVSLSLAAGADGVIASGKEAALLRERFGQGPIIVTPGIRPTNSAPDDQVRIVTPTMAIRSGATNLVIGRPITKAENPRAATEAILAEIHAARQSV